MTDSAEDRDEFLQIYLEESGEETEQLVKLLLHLEQSPDDMETLREAFRLLHTFKGSSGMMGFDRINALAHELETRFDACRSGRAQMTSETVSVALQCVDFFQDFLVELQDGKEDQGDPTPLIEALAATAETGAATSAEKSSETTVAEQQEEEIQAAPEGPSESDDAASPQPEEPAEAVTTSQPETAEPEPEQPEATEHGPDEVTPVVASSPLVTGPVQEVTLGVRLSERIELPDLKARLIVARLQALGDVISTEPSLETIEQVDPPVTLQIRIRSASDRQALTSSIDLEGVAEVFVIETEPPQAAAAASSDDQQAQPAADQAASSQPAEKQAAAAKPEPAPQSPSKSAPAGSSPPARGGETIRVGIDRLDRLMNLAGELVVTNARFDQLADEMRLLFRSGGSIEAGSPLAESLLRAMSPAGNGEEIEDIQQHFGAERITGIVGNDGGSEEGAALRRGWMERGRRVSGQVSETVDQLARLSRNIQQAVLETRMIPIGPLFNRFRRTVRDIAVKQGKPVRLELEGEMTELDKRMVDELGDPMVHLIRNALDHGIEAAETRQRSGKSLEGLIKLRAYHQSNHVVIEISDDGAGIDAARVRSRALERGLATESELRMMPDREVFGYIWHAGFSTAEKVSDISGRGVGMDVVRDRIGHLGGVVELDSQPGLGSTVSIRLPLTLAIVNAMIVRYRDFRLAIPVTDVIEIHGVPRDEIFESQGREMIDVRGRLLPLYRLDELFTWNDYLPPPRKTCNALVQAVLVRHGHRCLAIEVDDLDGNSDIVIKSLDEHFSHIPGLGGACVMGDGEVCLVLDTASLGFKAEVKAEKPAPEEAS